jgi:hypothetical protein
VLSIRIAQRVPKRMVTRCKPKSKLLQCIRFLNLWTTIRKKPIGLNDRSLLVKRILPIFARLLLFLRSSNWI